MVFSTYCFLTAFYILGFGVSSDSNVTPRISGFLLVRTGMLSISIVRGVFIHLVHSGKSVAENKNFCLSFYINHAVGRVDPWIS